MVMFVPDSPRFYIYLFDIHVLFNAQHLFRICIVFVLHFFIYLFIYYFVIDVNIKIYLFLFIYFVLHLFVCLLVHIHVNETTDIEKRIENRLNLTLLWYLDKKPINLVMMFNIYLPLGSNRLSCIGHYLCNSIQLIFGAHQLSQSR